MIIILAFAFLSGIVTILSPCILPVLPIVLSGSLGRGRARPYGVVAGFIVSFATFTLALTAVVQALGIPPDAMRWVAVVLIVLFGLVLTVPVLSRWFETATSRLAGMGTRSAQAVTVSGQASATPRAAGFWSGLPVGLGLGLVWTPCVGPIMASVISLALTQRLDGGAILITLAYTIGTAIPMLAVMLGGRALLNRVGALRRRAPTIQRVFGILMIILGIGIGLGWDRTVQAGILQAFPAYGTGLTALEQIEPVQAALKARAASDAAVAAPDGDQFSGAPDKLPADGQLGRYGLAPPILTDGNWFNTPNGPAGSPAALAMAELRGKVVMVDFWTYSCINCVRTLPFLRAWYEKYRDKGLVIIGVHTPEFEFEKQPGNLAAAIRDLGVTWPVVQDNNYAQWIAYHNQYWPSHYFIDAKGQVRYMHFGEGGYAVSEQIIQALLQEAGTQVATSIAQADPRLESLTPETYLGYERGQGLVSAVAPEADRLMEYRPAGSPGQGQWSLDGRWTMAGQYIESAGSGVLELGFAARDVYLVIEPREPGGSIAVKLDGVSPPDNPDLKSGSIRPESSRLYQLVKLPSAGTHLLRLEVKGKLRLFAFTFG